MCFSGRRSSRGEETADQVALEAIGLNDRLPRNDHSCDRVRDYGPCFVREHAIAEDGRRCRRGGGFGVGVCSHFDLNREVTLHISVAGGSLVPVLLYVP